MDNTTSPVGSKSYPREIGKYTLTDSSFESGLMRFLDRSLSDDCPHSTTADPRDYVLSPNATRCSSGRRIPGYLALQPFRTDAARNPSDVYRTPCSWLATQWSHLRDVSLLESYRRGTQSTRQEKNVPIPSPPNLNERRGPKIVRPHSRASRESVYIRQFCSFCPLPSVFATSLSYRLVTWSSKASRCQS